MQECIDFRMDVEKKIPEVMEFVSKKMVEEKMISYCSGDKTEIEQFTFWCKDYLDIDKVNGSVHGYNDVQMYIDYVDTFKAFVCDLAKTIPDAKFSGSIEKSTDDFGAELIVRFEMENGEIEFDEEEIDEFDF